jgi:dihydrofolate reductase
MTLDDFLRFRNDIDGDIFVIGGEQVYRQLMPYVGTLYATEVETNGDGCDAFFSTDFDDFSVVEDSGLLVSKERGQIYRFLTYKRKKVSNIK